MDIMFVISIVGIILLIFMYPEYLLFMSGFLFTEALRYEKNYMIFISVVLGVAGSIYVSNCKKGGK